MTETVILSLITAAVSIATLIASVINTRRAGDLKKDTATIKTLTKQTDTSVNGITERTAAVAASEAARLQAEVDAGKLVNVELHKRLELAGQLQAVTAAAPAVKPGKPGDEIR